MIIPQKPRQREMMAVVMAIFAVLILPFFFSQEVLLPFGRAAEYSPGERAIHAYRLIGSTVLRTLVIAGACFSFCFFLSSLLLVFSRRTAGMLEILANGMRFLPAVAWLPITITVVGMMTLLSQLVFVALGVAPVMLFYMLNGLRKCPKEKLQVGVLSGASKMATFRFIVLPSAREEIFQSFRLGLGLAFVLVLVFEFLFPSVNGISRIVEILEILRYTKMDSVLFTLLVLCVGISLDRLTLTLYKMGTTRDLI
jgi:ABC-type nitrate/sulfonate/bicarbonate transport system permease component